MRVARKFCRTAASPGTPAPPPRARVFTTSSTDMPHEGRNRRRANHCTPSGSSAPAGPCGFSPPRPPPARSRWRELHRETAKRSACPPTFSVEAVRNRPARPAPRPSSRTAAPSRVARRMFSNSWVVNRPFQADTVAVNICVSGAGSPPTGRRRMHVLALAPRPAPSLEGPAGPAVCPVQPDVHRVFAAEYGLLPDRRDKARDLVEHARCEQVGQLGSCRWRD